MLGSVPVFIRGRCVWLILHPDPSRLPHPSLLHLAAVPFLVCLSPLTPPRHLNFALPLFPLPCTSIPLVFSPSLSLSLSLLMTCSFFADLLPNFFFLLINLVLIFVFCSFPSRRFSFHFSFIIFSRALDLLL